MSGVRHTQRLGNLKGENLIKGIIVYHHTALGGTAFDVFVHEKYKKEFKELKEHLYDVDCSIARAIAKANPKLVFMGSEDFCHIPEVNYGMKQFVEELKAKGFIEIDLRPLENIMKS